MRHPFAAALRPKRILHVLFSPRMAGSERYCVDLANRQAELGYEVHVAGTPGSPMAAELAPQVRFHALRLPFFRGLQLQHLSDRMAIDIAHAHLSPACKALARVTGVIGRVATLHVGYKAHQHGRLDGLICVNRAQSARLGSYGGHARVVSNWLPASRPAQPGHAGPCRLRSELGIAADALLIGAVGRLHGSKGMDLLIQAFRATAPADAALVILGEGPQRAALEKLRAGDPRIHLPGFRADVLQALHDVDLFVSPSREESFGLAIIEAMSIGLPVLSTAAEGPREILQTHPIELVAPDSLPELAAGLSRALAALPSREDGRRLRIRYELSAFDAGLSLAHIADFYDAVMSQVQRAHASHAPLAHSRMTAV